MPEDFLSLETLRTFPVAVAVTWMLVKFFFGWLIDTATNNRVRTRYVVFAVAALVLAIPDVAGGVLPSGSAWAGWVFWLLLNAVVVALAAMKGHEALVERRGDSQ